MSEWARRVRNGRIRVFFCDKLWWSLDWMQFYCCIAQVELFQVIFHPIMEFRSLKMWKKFKIENISQYTSIVIINCDNLLSNCWELIWVGQTISIKVSKIPDQKKYLSLWLQCEQPPTWMIHHFEPSRSAMKCNSNKLILTLFFFHSFFISQE